MADAAAHDAGISGADIIVDFVSDVICPWCYVGRRNLAAAIALRPALRVTSVWRPYQLYPGIPPQGMDRTAFMLARFGPDVGKLRPMREALEAAAGAAGLQLQLERAGPMPNTLDCHRLIVWAQGQGLGSAMEERLFRAYFEEGADLTRLDVLADLAAEAGLQRDIVASLLAGDAERARIIADCETAGAMGVTGVPAMILNRRFKVLGAQAPQVLADAFDRVMRPGEAITG